MERVAAIAGIHEYPLRVAPGVSSMQIKAESMKQALDDAGLSWGDVDGLYDALDGDGGGGLGLAAYLGINPRMIDTTQVGGSSYEFHAAHALRDIAAGAATWPSRPTARPPRRCACRSAPAAWAAAAPPGSRTWKRPTAQP